MTIISSETLHATCIAIEGRGVLLAGPSGAGKSDLALRLIDRGAELVSDDYTILSRESEQLIARAPDGIRGKFEVRGIGIVSMPQRESAPVALIVRIEVAPDRLPDAPGTRRIAGIDIEEIALPALEPSATIKVELALRRVGMAA